MSKLRSVLKGEVNWDVLSKAVIYVFLTWMMVYQCLTANLPYGESNWYMLSALSIESRFSLQVNEEDIVKAETEFPFHYESMKDKWDNGGFAEGKNGGYYSYYSGTYSLLCIPLLKLFRLLDLSRAYAFSLTNVLLFSAALFYVFKKLKAERKTVFITIVFLACSPAIAYLWRGSAAVMIFSFITISLVNLLNKEHKKAAFYISIAGTMNITAMAIGIAIIFDYFWIQIANAERRNFTGIVKYLWSKALDILALAACFIPFLIAMVYNLITFGALAATTQFADFGNWMGRFWAYLVDWNFGMLPYFQISFIMFTALIIYGLIKRQRLAFTFAIAFFGTLAGFALEFHINHDTSGISRYGSWLCSVLIMFVCTQIPIVFLNHIRIRRIATGLLCVSIALTALISAHSLITRSHPNRHSPLAEFVLDYVPALYNPYPSTFICRTLEVDGGYYDLRTYPEPIVYENSDDYITKILIPAGCDLNQKWFTGKPEHIERIENKMNSIGDREYVYITVNPSWKIRFN